jgi:hypothetical protein
VKVISTLLLSVYLLFPALHTQYQISHIYHYDLTGDIDYDSVRPLEGLIQGLHASDTLYVYINSPGGIVNAGNELIDIIKPSPVHIVAVTGYFIASMAIDVTLACDQVILGINGQQPLAIIHAAYVSFGGNPIHTWPGLKAVHAVQISRYKSFLTKQELYQIFVQWKDLPLNMTSFVSRVNLARLQPT